MKLIDDWRKRRRDAEETQIFADVFDDRAGSPPVHTIREWSDQELHARLSSGELYSAAQSMAQRELERRKAWEAPEGRAFWISVAALLISAGALVVAILGN